MTVYSGEVAGDLRLREGDDASAVTSVGGSVKAYPGATIDLSACTSVWGWVEAYQGATILMAGLDGPLPSRPFIQCGRAVRAMAHSEPYFLMLGNDGLFSAGCRGPWTAERALAHWSKPERTDERARIFAAAIRAEIERRAA